jgi:hypothetical protein
VLFTSLREKSHFLPLVPFIGALQRRGHVVGVSAPADFAERVHALGAEFLPFGHPGEEGLGPIWARMRDATGDALMTLAVGELFAGACAGAAVPGLLEIVERWKPDVVLRESCEFAGLVAAEKLGVRHARIAIFGQKWEADIVSLAATPVDHHGRAVGLAPDPGGERIRNEVALTLFPQSFEAAQPVGALHRIRLPRKDAPPLPDWWGSPQGRFVYVTLGMVAGGVERARVAYRAAIDALAELEVRALLTVGTDLPLDALGELPPNVHVERFVPQDDVIPHAAAVVCHGGSGTVLGALAAGVPLVVAPMFADQPYNAERITAIGAGLAVPPGNAEELRTVLARVLAEESFRSASERMAREMTTHSSLDDAVSEIARICEVPLPG